MTKYFKSQAKTYSSSATETENSPSHIEEGPRCQVLKLLHGAEVGYTNMVKKFLPSVEMEEGIKDETKSPVLKTESKLSENIQPVSKTVTSAASTTIKFKNSPSRKKSETRVVYRDGRPEMGDTNLETLIKSSAGVPHLMGRRRLRDDLEVKLSSKIKKTQNILASNLPIKMISKDCVKVPVEDVTSQRIGSGMTKMRSQ